MYNLSLPLQRINQYDLALCQLCNRQSRHFSVRRVFGLASRLGDGVFWYTLLLALWLRDPLDSSHALFHILSVALIGTLLYKFIKGKTLRPRPFNVYPSIVCVGKALDQFSFPSGHTLHAVSFSILIVAHYPALFWLVVPFSLLVALSRPILGLHYPSDVLAGGLLGAGIAILSFQFI
jgi:undecaprenyl-diphosphatase